MPDPTVNGGGGKVNLEKCNFRNFRSPVTLILNLNRVIRHTVVHRSSIYIPNFIEIGKTFCGRTDKRLDGRTYVYVYVPTDGHFRPL